MVENDIQSSILNILSVGFSQMTFMKVLTAVCINLTVTLDLYHKLKQYCTPEKLTVLAVGKYVAEFDVFS